MNGDSQESPSSLSADPEKYRLEDEPLPSGAPVDYRYFFDLMRDRVEREEDRGKSLDGKTATIIAGIVASIGFSLRANGSIFSYAAAMLYLVPLCTLFLTFQTRQLQEAPTAEAILKFFPSFPVTTLKSGCEAMMNAIRENRIINDRKANLFDRAVLFTAIATAIVLIVQVSLAGFQGGYFGNATHGPTAIHATRTVAVPSSAPTSTNGCRHDRLHAKGCRNGNAQKVTAPSVQPAKP